MELDGDSAQRLDVSERLRDALGCEERCGCCGLGFRWLDAIPRSRDLYGQQNTMGAARPISVSLARSAVLLVRTG
jgi:hypothetical protein